MQQICVLTDNSAQFPTASFPGYGLVNIIPMHVKINGRDFKGGGGLKAQDLPPSVNAALDFQVQPPTVEEFRNMYAYLGQRYEEIIVVLISSHLTTTVKNAMEAAGSIQGRLKIHIVDSQSVAVGLGLLVQEAAKAAEEGLPGADIVRMIRGLIPHIYCMLCIPGLTYLEKSDVLGGAQALVGEKLELMPLFIMDSGKLLAVQKARSARHLVDCLHEFVGEFAGLEHIAVMQGVPPYEQEVRSLRERFQLDFTDIPVSEHIISASLATLLGPATLGIFVKEFFSG